MKEYTAAAAAALLAALLLSRGAGAWGDRRLWLGLLAFGFLTVIFDLVMTGVGLFAYAARYRSGLALGQMPLEDLAYGLALYLVAVSAWSWSPRKPA